MSSGQTISEQRKFSGITQEKLADQINVSRQTIAMWETLKQLPSDNVAIVAARFFDISENELLEQVRWDRLHQRVSQLEKRYDTKIIVNKQKNGNSGHLSGTLKNATQTIDGVTLTVIQIYKSIYNIDPYRIPLDFITKFAESTTTMTIVHGPHDIQIYHNGERLILHVLCENRNHNIQLASSDTYIEDNLGNRFRTHGSGSSIDRDIGEHASRIAVSFYCPPPEASTFTLHYDVVNGYEGECDTISFENVPINGKGIAKTFDEDIITYNGTEIIKNENSTYSYQINLLHNIEREVRHVGISAITDNLGNKYTASVWYGGYDEDKGVFYDNYQIGSINPDATSLSFKYLFARKILTFELKGLPLA